MQVVSTDRKVIVENAGKHKEFAIAQNAHAFKVLSDALYSDRIKAIVRELSTNAIDSHKMAGHAKPFTITLPNLSNPIFSIRDYGVGLSPDQVMSVYSTYFASDKTHTNDLTGGFGLGSKSPFSYTDSFTIISRYEGVKSTYNAFIGSKDRPEIVEMCNEPTDEGNGVEISFPVKKDDFNTFAHRLSLVSSYIDIQPEVLNYGAGYQWAPRTVTYSETGSNWKVRHNDGTGANIVMGGVAYPINAAQFSDHNNDAMFHHMAQMPIDIFLKVGDVAINPSREALNYRKEDIATLKATMTVIYDEIKELISVKIRETKSVWQAVATLRGMRSTLGCFRTLIETVKIFHMGQEITTGWSHEHEVGCTIRSFTKFKRGHKEATIYKDAKHYITVHPDFDTTIIFDDLPRGGIGRVRAYKETTSKALLYIYDRRVGNATTAADIQKMFFGADVLLTSSMPKPIRAERQKNGKEVIYSWEIALLDKEDHDPHKNNSRLNHEMIGKSRSQIAEYLEDNSDRTLVIVREYYHGRGRHSPVVTFEGSKNHNDLFHYIGAVAKLGLIEPTTLLFVRDDSYQQKLLLADENVVEFNTWVAETFFPAVKERLKDAKTSETIFNIIQSYYTGESLRGDKYGKILLQYETFKIADRVPACKILDKKLDSLEDLRKIKKKVDSKYHSEFIAVIRNFFLNYGDMVKLPVTDKKYAISTDDLKCYSMLDFVTEYSLEVDVIRKIVTYLNLAD